MNNNFSSPTTGDKANLRTRYTIVTPSVKHTLSEYKSIKGTRSHYCFYLRPDAAAFHKSRYWCGFQCKKCKEYKYVRILSVALGKKRNLN